MTFTMYVGLTAFTLLSLGLATYYIPKRLCDLLNISRRKTAISIFAAIIVSAGWGMGTIGHVSNPLLLALFKFSLIFLGMTSYLLLFLLGYELISRFVPIPKKPAGIAVIVLSVLVTAYGFVNARNYQIIKVDIPLANLQEEVRILHAPDVHLGPFRGKNTLQAVVDDIKRLQPDFVVFNGDLVDGQEGMEPGTLELLQQVSQPIYFTVGNHDIYVGIEAVKQRLRQIGVHVMENDVVQTHGIQLIGLDYMNADDEVYDAHASPNTETIKSVLPTLNIDPSVPSVLAHHSPVGISYMDDAGVNLVLSGHTHAGQFFPATLVAKLQFQYLKGLYHYNDVKIFISQGVGTFGPPIRLGTQAEATLVRLVPQS